MANLYFKIPSNPHRKISFHFFIRTPSHIREKKKRNFQWLRDKEKQFDDIKIKAERK